MMTQCIFFNGIYQIILGILYCNFTEIVQGRVKAKPTKIVSSSLLNFEIMHKNSTAGIVVEQHVIKSVYLKRDVKVDCYLPLAAPETADISLLLINDGQDLVTMQFDKIIERLYHQNAITPLFCIGLHCGADRRNEYATAKIADYKGRGIKAACYTQFIFKELLPFIHKAYFKFSFKEKAYAGFSMGGLSAMDIVWNNAHDFTKVGVFSGSFWWRDKDQHAADFDESKNRIMHRQIREGDFAPWLQFFFEVGTEDETADRNNNGIIDAIDDTISLIDELKNKGYTEDEIKYVELKDGRHDVSTWARAFPSFLLWGWGG